jgi:hypothetical protein
MGKMSVFAKKIPFFGYENFVEDSNNLAKIRRKFYFKKIHLDVKFETFWRKRKSNEKGFFVSPSIQIRPE